jgi:uncharacterized phage-associated protein
MTHSAKAIANAFLNLAAQEGAEVRPLKLQKLVYYASGYHAGAYGEPLLKSPMEAWEYGPVVPDLYREFKQFGSEPITRLATDFDDEFELEEVPIPTADKRAMSVVDFVWKTYKKYNGLQMSDMTHAEGTPWDTVRKNNPGSKNAQIPHDVLQSYFSGLVKSKAA